MLDIFDTHIIIILISYKKEKCAYIHEDLLELQWLHTASRQPNKQ